MLTISSINKSNFLSCYTLYLEKESHTLLGGATAKNTRIVLRFGPDPGKPQLRFLSD